MRFLKLKIAVIFLIACASQNLLSMEHSVFLSVGQGSVVATFPLLISLVVVDKEKKAVLLGTSSRRGSEVWAAPMAYVANIQRSSSGNIEHFAQAVGNAYGINVSRAEHLYHGLLSSKDSSDQKIVINFGYVTADFSGTPQVQGSPFRSFAWYTQEELPEDHQYGLPAHTKKQLSDVIEKFKRR